MALMWVSNLQKLANLSTAKQQFVEISRDKTAIEMHKLNEAQREIYENLRTLATLPGLASIDRHAKNISGETAATFQHLYNNLAAAVKISEVYIVPIDFSPNRIDPVTGKTEEPIMMFDSLILNAGSSISASDRAATPEVVMSAQSEGLPEIEDYEYAELVNQAKWFQSKYPSRSSIAGLNFPLIASPEMITCDNTIFNKTKRDADRSGIILSVPFFDPTGKLKGMVSAILLSDALMALLPQENAALISLSNQFLRMGAGAIQMPQSHSAIRAVKADDSLIYSEVIGLPKLDARASWSVWVANPDDMFWNSDSVKNIQTSFVRNLLSIAFVTFAMLVSYLLLLRNLDHVKALNKAMATDHQLSMTKLAEAEANERVLALGQLNQKVTSLNADLENNLRALKAAQNDAVAKSKMAQLGQLVATVAHEIRNPLGGVRTSAFLLQRRLKDSPEEIQVALGRIEKGITRCDNIITQLLDFSRSNEPVTKVVVVDEWLTKVLQELAQKLPRALSLQCNLGLEGHSAEFDPERLERVITNLVNNAADAMIDPKTGLPHRPEVASTVSITTSKSTDGVEFTVSDNGPGIPEAVLEKIREPLFTTKSFGTGLGIPAAEKVVELHGGRLSIKSVPGCGAEFSFNIPKDKNMLRAA